MKPDPSPTPANPPAAACENCGAPLYGKYCYACGQPRTGMVRHFSSILSDVADSVLNIDERVFKTLLPLYLRPGKLTLDYFAGKRARYVTPFRLVFFLAIIAFFALQVSLRIGMEHAPIVAGAANTTATAPATAKPDTHFTDNGIQINGKTVWDGRGHVLKVTWLPGVANDWLNNLVGNARANLHHFTSGNPEEMKAESRRLVAGMLAVAPTVLFVMLPVFALLLKLFYLFKHRLYMEHLIVAMHSHAFLMLSILVLLAITALRGALPASPWLTIPLTILLDAAWAWMLAYLFVMQKRVYRQRWFMTTMKFTGIGCCYTVLLVFGTMIAALASLTDA